MINFRIVELLDEEINTNDPMCLMNAFKYMVEDIQTESRWFGSNIYSDCVEYIDKHLNNS